MFGLFQRRCPLDIREKTWVELRMQWLIEQLGLDQIAAVEVITPSDRHFPEAFVGTDEDIERIFVFVCGQLGVPRDSVEIAIFNGVKRPDNLYDERGSALGLYEQRSDESERHTVWIERSRTTDPLQLISTMAHELAHCVLLGDKLLTDAEADHEFVTDLLPVVRGMGIFAANAAVQEESHVLLGGGSWRSVSKVGYLPSRMLGYALAVFAWLRDDDPTWTRYLNGDPRNTFKVGLGFLQKTGDCLCHSPTRSVGSLPRRLSEKLIHKNPGVRLTAFWDLRNPQAAKLPDDDWSALLACLDDDNPILICEAALAITALNRTDVRVVDRGIDLLQGNDGDPEVLSSVMLMLGTQLGEIHSRPETVETVVDLLLKRLAHPAHRVVAASLTALRNLRPNCDFFALRQLLDTFRQSLLACENILIARAVAALRAICESPQNEVRAFFPDDEELKIQAYAALSAEIDEKELLNDVHLPTPASLPVPLPGWRPTPVLVPEGSNTDPGGRDS